MSKVISFRLNPDNQREGKALAVLQDWLSQGFSTRHTMTDALLSLTTTNSRPVDHEVLQDLSQQIKELIENIEAVEALDEKEGISSNEKLSEGFVTSILKVTKPGLKLD